MLSSDFPVSTDILSELARVARDGVKERGDWDIHYMTLLHFIFIIQIRQIIQFTTKNFISTQFPAKIQFAAGGCIFNNRSK